MLKATVSLILFGLICSQVNGRENFCVMDGPCMQDDYGNDLNCINERSAAPLPEQDKDTFETLKDLCPHLVTDGSNSAICCTAQQINIMKNSMALSNVLLGRCPACIENFKQIFCDFTCSPNQDNFLVPLKTIPLPSDPTKQVLKDVSHYMSKSFMYDTFDSCKNVQGLSSSSKALDLMCGAWGSEKCSPERWLEFMGTSAENGGMAPFDIQYHLVTESKLQVDSKTIIPFSGNTQRCNEAAGKSNEACSCGDCPESCTV